MLIPACMAKIHRAMVTEANLDYVGSITVDPVLLEAAGILPSQYVNITSLENGTFWRTYVIAGESGKGDICLNGSAAHHFKPGHLIIILAEVLVTAEELKKLTPRVVLVDGKNQITKVIDHPPAGTTWPPRPAD